MSVRTAKHAGRAAERRAKPARGVASDAGSSPAGPGAPPVRRFGAGWTWPAALAALFAVAFAWRLAYLHRLAASPLGGSLTEDARFYWNWAGYLLRHGFMGARPFFLAPLYPYTLALLRVPLGDSVERVLEVQALWGAAATVLLADAVRRITRPGVGLVVGAIAALFESAVFFDGLVLTESLLYGLESLLLWWIVACGSRAHRAWVGAITGALIGVIAEGRATSSLLLLPAALWIVDAARGRGAEPAVAHARKHGASAARVPAGRALPSLAALAAGFLLVTTPVAIRNFAVGHEWIPFTYNLGFNLYAGYNPEATGAFNSITGTHRASSQTEELTEAGAQVDGREYLKKVEGVDLSPAASSAYWANKALSWIRAHPMRALALSARKLVMIWNRDEYAQIENVREFRAVAGPIGLPFVGSFLFVGALAMAGIVLSLRKRAWAGPAAAAARFATGYLAVVTLSIVPFFVTDRYRHHLVPAALVLAGLTLERLWALFRGDRRAPGTLALALALGFTVVNLPAPHMSADKYAWGLATDLGQRWAQRGRWDLAVQSYERAIAVERSGGLAHLPGATAATERSDLYYDYANALTHVGRDADAVAAYERAVAEAPDRAQAVRALADWYAHQGRAAEAESLYATLPAKVGGNGLAAAGRAWVAAREGRYTLAESLFAAAVRSDPTLADAWAGLIRLEVQRGAIEDARGTLERARIAGLTGPPLTAHEALLAAVEGHPAEAERFLARVPPAALATDQTLTDVVRVTRSILAQGHPPATPPRPTESRRSGR